MTAATSKHPEARPLSDGPSASPRARRAGEPLLDWVERIDPDVAHAVVDVDRTLLAECRQLSPLDRLRACSDAARGLGHFRGTS